MAPKPSRKPLKPSPAPAWLADFRKEVGALGVAPTNVRLISGFWRDVVCEAVRMRKAGEAGDPNGTVCSLSEFHRHLNQKGVMMPGGKKPTRLKVSYSCLRGYILEVLGYAWPRTSGAAGVQVKDD